MKKPRVIRGLIFDNGDILFDASLWRKWLAHRLSCSGRTISYTQLVPIWERHLISVYRGEREYWSAFHNMLDEFAITEADQALIAQDAKEKGKSLQSERKPMPFVPETLERLSSLHIRLAVLSDSESGEAGVRAILRQLGIENCFDAVVSSRDLGFVKPERQAYQAAADAISLPVSECGFVGHDIDELEGAMRLPMYSIAYNYAPEASADIYLGSFDELVSRVIQQ